jgi:hypothetical protein
MLTFSHMNTALTIEDAVASIKIVTQTVPI